MPRKTDPGKIKVGHGLAASDSVEVNALIPGQGEPGAAGGGSGMVQHIQDEHDAHPASSVSVDDVPKIYDASNVEGVLDELAALVPPKPAQIGFQLHYFNTTGIPDWGILKLDDATWFQRNQDQLSPTSEWFSYVDNNGVPDPDTGMEVYPYFWRTPRTARDFNPAGNDPYSDKMFNVASNTYIGGGVGEAHAGAFTDDISDKIVGREITMTHEIIPSSGEYGGKEVVLSGMVFPADRGTLALVRLSPTGFFDPDTLDPEDFVKNKVLAAINLGQGILDKCDGQPGGIFWIGEHGGECAPHSYDPFSYPGRATGQYDLRELHTGLHRKKDGSSPDGADLPLPFSDYDGDGVTGAPAAGQVRLGTDPNSGIPMLADGIPIFGAGSMARAGGNDHNFFRYRLPYLVDYTKPNGLKWTPPQEHHRYFDKPLIAFEESEELDYAGDYRAFEKDYWTFQVGRYRHQFKLPSELIDEHAARKCGHYILLHFKKEQYFEEFVRDQEVPTKDKLYSANLVNWNSVGHPFNKTQEPEDANPVAASSYHVLRANVFEDVLGDKDSEFCPGDVPPIIDGEGQHLSATVNLKQASDVIKVSGVPYLITGDNAASGTVFEDLKVQLKAPDHANNVYGLFETSFLTHDGSEGTGQDAAHQIGDNKWLGNMFPAFLNTLSFTPDSDTMEMVELAGQDPFTSHNVRRGRIHFGVGHLQDPTSLTYPVPERDEAACMELPILYFKGDKRPKFSRDAVLRAFFRRPLNHGRDFLDYAKFFNTGIRILTMSELKPVTMLWHGGDHRKGGEALFYSNAYNNPNAVSGGGDHLWDFSKHRNETFLDETFRLRSDFRTAAGDAVLPTRDTENLVGPGLPHGDYEIQALPFNRDTVLNLSLSGLTWLGSASEDIILSTPPVEKELQVAGWPDRNPPIQDGVGDTTFPSGVLIMPQHDYSANCMPIGPDYSGLSDEPRSYTRLFHNVGTAGCSKVKISLTGINLEHFKFSSAGKMLMSIYIKVPGLTTWMDIGRRDGEGPSKQDPFADSAGCMILGPGTADLDPVPAYGLKQCVVECNLGAAAALYEPVLAENTDLSVPCQMLLKVVIYPKGKMLNLEQGGAESSVSEIAGLVGIMVEGVK